MSKSVVKTLTVPDTADFDTSARLRNDVTINRKRKNIISNVCQFNANPEHLLKGLIASKEAPFLDGREHSFWMAGNVIFGSSDLFLATLPETKP